MNYNSIIKQLTPTERVLRLKEKTLNQERYVSIEQAKLVTESWKEYADKSTILKRAYAFEKTAMNLKIGIDEDELIVGNRTAEACAGVVFPEGGIRWVVDEIDTLPCRRQDPFGVNLEDKKYFLENIAPFWLGKSLEDTVNARLSDKMKDLEVVGKLNQKDHAQGHICPDVAVWLEKGPSKLLKEAAVKLKSCSEEKKDYYNATIIVLAAACNFIKRYATLALELAENANTKEKKNYENIAESCNNIASSPVGTFRDSLQSLWFLMVLLQMESNASSFSPGRADQYLYRYFDNDLRSGKLSLIDAQELVDALFIKFNQIVYLRNAKGATFFAGFPIGFNIAIGGKTSSGDGTNNLSYLLLNAQEHVRMRQPNLSARLHQGSPTKFVKRIVEVISIGTGMPQIFSDDSVIPALIKAGYSEKDAIDYAIAGCVEITTQGNTLGFSDAGMFNIVKLLEITLNNGICMQTGKVLGLPLGYLFNFKSYEELESVLQKQMEHAISIMVKGLDIIEDCHKSIMPSPLLSSVINDCINKGIDVTAGGAKYNFSGIQLIQVANLSDSLAAIEKLVFGNGDITATQLMQGLRNNFADETLRMKMLHHAPKYGNDIECVDRIADRWVVNFRNALLQYKNYRNGDYTIGLYTVSAHVPMGMSVAATPDGRRSGEPLADGGMSSVYGRDENGPTALLNSVARINSENIANGSLLNMKFAPALFKNSIGKQSFISLLNTFVKLGIHHVQFNVVDKEDLLDARKNPENHRNLLVRVAGYTANYIDLADNLQDEIIARTEYSG